MLKELIQVVLGVVASVLALLGFGSGQAKLPADKPQPTPAVVSENSSQNETLARLTSVTLNGENFRFASFKVDEPEKLQLFSNLSDKRAAKNLRQIKKCRFLVNGTFYSQDYKPLGWFYSEEKLLSLPQENRLLNGFLSSNPTGQVVITDLPPQGMVKWGLQSGPLLIFSGQALPLAIREDEPRRRLVAAQNQTGELYFLALIGEKSLSSGPTLTVLPQVVVAIGRELGETFTTAINLDGGSASAFLTDSLEIDELSFVGSYFCLPGD